MWRVLTNLWPPDKWHNIQRAWTTMNNHWELSSNVSGSCERLSSLSAVTGNGSECVSFPVLGMVAGLGTRGMEIAPHVLKSKQMDECRFWWLACKKKQVNNLTRLPNLAFRIPSCFASNPHDSSETKTMNFWKRRSRIILWFWQPQNPKTKKVYKGPRKKGWSSKPV